MYQGCVTDRSMLINAQKSMYGASKDRLILEAQSSSRKCRKTSEDRCIYIKEFPFNMYPLKMFTFLERNAKSLQYFDMVVNIFFLNFLNLKFYWNSYFHKTIKLQYSLNLFLLVFLANSFCFLSIN